MKPKNPTDPQKLIHHDWNVICDTCGRKRKRSDCLLSYFNGDIPVFIACKDGCADERHPLNSPPPIIWDGKPVPNARPDVSAANAFYVGTVTVDGFSSPAMRTSPYRIGISHPGANIGFTNPVESPFNLQILQLIGNFY